MKMKSPLERLLLALPLALALAVGACSDDDNPAAPGDTTAPGAITNLAKGTVTASSVALTWTAPGDDGSTGTAAQYDIRYSTSTISLSNWATAMQVAGEPGPGAAGAAQAYTVNGLSTNTTYYFAVRTADEKPNWSGVSNVVQATTVQTSDATPPAAVADLSAAALDGSTVELTWTAPGDDGNTGTAASYDARWSTSVITSTNWGSATQATGEPLPAEAGTEQTLTISSLQADTDYYFALRTSDEVPNVSDLSNVVMVRTPASETPPDILIPDFPDTVCISSTDQYAQIAKAFAQGQLALIGGYATLAAAFFSPMQFAEWQQSGDCWNYTFNYSETCTSTYQVCKSASVYTYAVTMNGSCFGTTYADWTAYRLVADQDARTATLYFYAENSTAVEGAWVWTWAADENSGTYTFYSGDPAPAAIEATLDWSRSADHNTYDMTYTIPESAKIVSHFEKSPCSGWLKNYLWDDSVPGSWWLQTDIVWNADGTGYWDTYDNTGALEEHHAW